MGSILKVFQFKGIWATTRRNPVHQYTSGQVHRNLN